MSSALRFGLLSTPQLTDRLEEANSVAAISAEMMLLEFVELPTGTSVVIVTLFFPVN